MYYIMFKDNADNSPVVFNCYRSLSANLNNFLIYFDQLLDKLFYTSIRVIICIDFNFDCKIILYNEYNKILHKCYLSIFFQTTELHWLNSNMIYLIRHCSLKRDIWKSEHMEILYNTFNTNMRLDHFISMFSLHFNNCFMLKTTTTKNSKSKCGVNDEANTIQQ